MKALVIIDLQEEYVGSRRGNADYENAFDVINEVSAMFRGANLPVFVVRDLSEGDGEGYANVRELHVEPTDTEILKYYNNSFWKTRLDELLKAKGVDWVLLCGSAAEFCVEATYFGALENGYQVHLLKDGILAVTKDGLAMQNKLRPMLTKEKVAALLAE
jgi:nicotinamidase-related amidase